MSDEMPLVTTLSPQESIRAQEAFWKLLARQAHLYAPESSSLPVETMQALADSILLTLRADREPRRLLTPDLEERFRRSQHSLRHKADMVQRLWVRAVRLQPNIENDSLLDTLNSLGYFQKRYDWRFFAQEIPCDIDYQLSCPVPDQFKGVDYVLEWLQQLMIETTFLRQFDSVLVRSLLTQSCPDYKGLHIDLFEPVAVNALGLSLLGQNPRTLVVSPSQCRRLEHLLRTAPEERLQQGIDILCAVLGITNGRTQQYLKNVARALAPRLQAALDAGSLAHVFLSF